MANYTGGGLYLWNKTDPKITTIEETAKSMQKINDSLAESVKKQSGWVDVVSDFDADPTGVVDSFTAIQNAINSIGNSGGGIVFIPKGTFKLSDTINVPWRVRLIGQSFDSVLYPPDGKHAIKVNGNDSEIAWLRIKGQSSDSRTVAENHGIKIDAGSVYWERMNIHDIRLDYLNGSGLTLIGAVRESWFKNIHSRSCGNAVYPVIEITSYLSNSEPANYLQWENIMVNFAYGTSIRVTAEYANPSRTGNWGLTFKDILIHGGNPDNHYIPNPFHGIYLDNISDSLFENIHVTNIHKDFSCVYLTSTKTYRSMRNEFKSLTLGGVVGEAFTNDSTQTGGTGFYLDNADTTYFEIKPVGLTKDFYISANAIRAYLGKYQIILGTANYTNLSGSFSQGSKHFAPMDFNGQNANGIEMIQMNSGIMIYSGVGNPEASLVANIGSLFMSTSLGKMFVKETGTGNTGWIQK